MPQASRHFRSLSSLAMVWLCWLVASSVLGVDFEREVQPILTARCLQCHGESEPEGGLRLSSRMAATSALESGQRAVVPSKADESELLRRISSTNADERMPPKGDPLSAGEQDLLRRWIAEGARWPEHWAYRKLVPPVLPIIELTRATAEDWPRSPIDSFVLAEQQARHLAHAAPADRRTLARRIYFDLLGLPPTPEEVRAFVSDPAPDALEQVVDRLLASPRYGERWARHWMDVVHYAETHGHDQDRPRENAWPYRDYLIGAFNRDLPYATFMQQQIAGDVFSAGDPQAMIATGFLATGPWDESSLQSIREDTIDRQIARYIDRDDIVTTVASTFLSTTAHCARCHDHKFDPIKQQDYYGLQAVFAAIDKADRSYEPDPEVATRRQELLTAKGNLPKLREQVDASLLAESLQADVAQWEQSIGGAQSLWQVLVPSEFKSADATTLTQLADHSLLASGPLPEKDTYTITASSDLASLTGIRLEVLSDPSLPVQGPGRQENGNLHLSEIVVTVTPKNEPAKKQILALLNPKADFDQSGWTIAHAVDGNPDTAWGIHPEVGKSHTATFELKEPLKISGGFTLTIELRQLHGRHHTIGRARLSVTAAPLPLAAIALPAEVANALVVPSGQRTDRQRSDLAAHILSQKYERELASLPPQQFIYAGTNQLAPGGKPRVVQVLKRGDILQPLEEAQPRGLSFLVEHPGSFVLADASNEGERRAALARWISDEKNALAWRSIVNRVWHHHFGRGIVDTPNDFGRMGSFPSHPALVDWLALELQRSGGSLKSLHRRIVSSSVFRQSSAHHARNAEMDADNHYLWRMNRSRLDAESIHDAIVQVAGTADLTSGGKSVRQFIQTPGIHVTPNVDYQGFDVDAQANHRRSVYRFIFRTLPDPFMESLDCADASQLTPTRTTSVTALQALAMLNDKFTVRQSERLAERIQREVGDNASDQIVRLFELTVNRTPSEREMMSFSSYVSKHGLANACRMLLNSNEFMFVN